MKPEEVFSGGKMKKIRLLQSTFNEKTVRFKASFHPVAFYAKDLDVLHYMMVMSHVTRGEMVVEAHGDLNYCLN